MLVEHIPDFEAGTIRPFPATTNKTDWYPRSMQAPSGGPDGIKAHSGLYISDQSPTVGLRPRRVPGALSFVRRQDSRSTDRTGTQRGVAH